MEFIFRPEKLSENLSGEISEAIAKRTEIFSRKKFPGLREKTDELNSRNLSEDALRKRVKFRRFCGIICIALGIFLFVPGLFKPAELTIPLIAGAIAVIYGFFAVIPRKTDAEKFEKKAKKLISAINSSLKSGDTVVFNDDGIFENGALLMKYENLEMPVETRNIFFVCDGAKILLLRKCDLVSGETEDFAEFIKNKKEKLR